MRIAFAGGGTGGHLVPGLHLLQHLVRAGELESLVWFTSGRSVEERVLAGLEERAAGAPVTRVRLRLEPPSGGAPSTAGLFWRTPAASRHARAALQRHDVQVVLGLGGFTSLPVVLAARRLRIPVVLFEINARWGRATKVLGRLADAVLVAWDDGVHAKAVCTGAPLPLELTRAPEFEPDREALAGEGWDPARPLLLVLGGSQGARALNQFAAAHAREWTAAGLQVLHQVGPGRADEGAADTPGYRAVEYAEDVPRLLSMATAVLCRGGGSSLAEIGAAARPALVVPYPHHPDQHQLANAEALGAGVRIVPEAELGEGLAREWIDWLGEAGREERFRMHEELVRVVPREGSSRMVDVLRGLVRTPATT